MQESILIRKQRRKKNEEQILHGVFCSETVSIQSEASGFNGSGKITVRIPEERAFSIVCGDRICRVGSCAWYTVTEVTDNRKQGSALSHWKVVGRR